MARCKGGGFTPRPALQANLGVALRVRARETEKPGEIYEIN